MGGAERGSPPEADLAALRRRIAEAVARVCPPWLAAHREDIVQNALVQLLRAGNPREGNRRYSSTYLLKVAHGATVDEIRRQARRKERAMGEMAAVDRVAAPVSAHAEAEAAGAELARELRACLQRLVRDRRLAVTLYLQGCGVAEIARRLRWKRKRSENLVYRGLADLRRCLRAKGYGP